MFSARRVPPPAGQGRTVGGRGRESLDPMEVVPAPNSTAPRTYFAIMEEDLTALEVPLVCDTTDTY